MRFITISEAEPGMTLAVMIEEVHCGQLFKLSPGVELTEDLIEQLRRHQVNFFVIEIDETCSTEETSVKLINSQKQIEAVFSVLKQGDGVARNLYSSLMDYRLNFS